MDTKILEQIGLTEGEIKVYLALLKLGTTKTGELIAEAKVSSSKVYKILDRLQAKGLVGHTIKAKTKHFTALPPKRILEYIDEKEKELIEKKETIKQFLPQLEQIQAKEKSEVTIFEGFKAIKNFYNNILDDLNSGDTYYILGATYGKDYTGIREFFHNYHLRRAKQNIKVKMLANIETKGNLEKSTLKNSEVKYLPQYFVTNMMIVFYKNKAFIYFLTEDPKGFLIENKEVVKSFEVYFNTFWKIAKK